MLQSGEYSNLINGWRRISIRFGYLYCSYSTIPPKGARVESESGAWIPDSEVGQPNPWLLFNGGPQQPRCSSESGGTREKCIFRRAQTVG